METAPKNVVSELDERSRKIFGEIVNSYLETGDPTGSRTLSRRLVEPLSPATVRNVMADLEEMGLLYAPHTSAGRLPTEAGPRLFVDGLLEIGALTDDERANIEATCAAAGKPVAAALEEATEAMSGLSRCAGLVFAPKSDRALKHAEFVNLGDGRAMVVMIGDDGFVENRIIDLPAGTPPSTLTQAGNYLNARLAGRTLEQARAEIESEIANHRAQIDTLTSKLVEQGLAIWATDAGDRAGGSLIIKGLSHLLEDVSAVADLERVRILFEALDTQDLLVRLLDATTGAEGVQIFIGSHSELFNLAGCSLVVAPFAGSRSEIVGAIGVIGPARINYARIVPIVDYTAKVIGRIVG
jgi:heat-inducible transcriptional repressor